MIDIAKANLTFRLTRHFLKRWKTLFSLFFFGSAASHNRIKLVLLDENPTSRETRILGGRKLWRKVLMRKSTAVFIFRGINYFLAHWYVGVQEFYFFQAAGRGKKFLPFQATNSIKLRCQCSACQSATAKWFEGKRGSCCWSGVVVRLWAVCMKGECIWVIWFEVVGSCFV